MRSEFVIRQSIETREADGVTLRRLFPVAGLRNHDPFVLFDHFRLSAGQGFPTHPHRGFEAITYLFSGCMQHADDLGNHSSISAGGAQRFTAGRGIVHSEMPSDNEITEGIQLWINLPQKFKAIEPDYQAINNHELRNEQWPGGWRREIVGSQSPLSVRTPAEYFELHLEAKGQYQWAPRQQHVGLVYVVTGQATVNQQAIEAGFALLVSQSRTLHFSTEHGAHMMVCFGQAHGEAIHQHGPYVD